MAMDWDELDRGTYRDEAEAVTALLNSAPLSADARRDVRAEAVELVTATRKAASRQGVVESFLQEFSLSTPEGLALMCLAEALLRTPDEDARDKLIAEKIGAADWASHLGQSGSLFVNASTWGLMLTGKLVDVDDAARTDMVGYLRRLARRVGEPVIAAAVAQAIRIMGEQFVLGRTIKAALARAASEGRICSFDMLGEGARTEADAARYESAYADAIHTVGAAASPDGPERGHGVSVKLSALSPRYEATHEAAVFETLYPRLKRLAVVAAGYNINFTIDAEEADRLALSLKLLDRLAHEQDLGAWTGLGLAVQAYQKRGPEVIERVAALARASGRRLMVRLVKGAYWDSEIKRAQVNGRPDYPVYTTKAATDLSYLVCAKALIAASPGLYAQFATHNAHTLAAVRRLAGDAGDEFEPEGAGQLPSSSSVCMAWARRSTPRPGSATPAGWFAPTPPSASMRTCCPIWSAACSKTAPTQVSYTCCSTIPCRRNRWWSIRSRWSRRWGRGRTRAFPGPPTSTVTGAIRPGSTFPPRRSGPGWSRRSPICRCWGPQARANMPPRCSRRPTVIGWWATAPTPRLNRSKPPSRPPRLPSRPGTTQEAPRAPRCCAPWPTPLKQTATD